MITAKIARYISERCNEYMEKLKNYKYDVEELIRERIVREELLVVLK